MANTSKVPMDKSKENGVTSFDATSFSTINDDAIPIKRLYVTNLPRNVARKDLKKIFSVYGEVQCSFITKHKNGWSYTFVTFNDEEDALKVRIAAKKKEIVCHGKVLKVSPAHSIKQPGNAACEGEILSMKKRNMKRRKKNRESHEEPSGPSINILDDDCLIKIFLLLPIIDRLRIERVCKRWQALNQQCWNNINDLKLPVDNSNDSVSKMSENTLEKILIRCGRFLNTLDIVISARNCKRDLISIAAQHCCNLTGLSVELVKNQKNNLARLFLNNKKLERLKIIDRHGDLKVACLRNLPVNSIKEISINKRKIGGSHEQFNKYASRSIQNMQKLWKLEIEGCRIEADALKLIVDNNAITHLKFPFCTFIKCINNIANLHGLVSLRLSGVAEVTDEFLGELVINCPDLQHLNIDVCKKVTNKGINNIAKLKNLDVLSIQSLNDITDVALKKMTTLKVLHCEYCRGVRDAGIIELIRNAPLLKELKLYETSVTISTLEVAHEVILNRYKSIPLKITVTPEIQSEFEQITPTISSLLIIQHREKRSLIEEFDLLFSGNNLDDDIDGMIEFFGLDEDEHSWEYASEATDSDDPNDDFDALEFLAMI